jgi:hypothetical protein
MKLKKLVQMILDHCGSDIDADKVIAALFGGTLHNANGSDYDVPADISNKMLKAMERLKKLGIKA